MGHEIFRLQIAGNQPNLLWSCGGFYQHTFGTIWFVLNKEVALVGQRALGLGSRSRCNGDRISLDISLVSHPHLSLSQSVEDRPVWRFPGWKGLILRWPKCWFCGIIVHS